MIVSVYINNNMCNSLQFLLDGLIQLSKKSITTAKRACAKEQTLSNTMVNKKIKQAQKVWRKVKSTNYTTKE